MSLSKVDVKVKIVVGITKVCENKREQNSIFCLLWNSLLLRMPVTWSN